MKPDTPKVERTSTPNITTTNDAHDTDIEILPSDATAHRTAIELMFFAYRDFISDPDTILAARGFGRAHHRVLHFVGCNPGLSITDLLDILKVTKQSLARVLRDMVEEAYIRQEIDADDRRRRLLYLTGRGIRLYRELIELQAARFERVRTEFGDKMLADWKRVMYALIDPQNRLQLENSKTPVILRSPL